jgi:hypothetical protein
MGSPDSACEPGNKVKVFKTYQKVPFSLFKRALVRYKEIYGHVTVMKSFIVPLEPAWPVEMWGLKLGEVTMRARNGRTGFTDASRIEELVSEYCISCSTTAYHII